MEELILPIDILCNLWTWDNDETLTVKFNKDGTGELWCRVEFSLFIANIFEWKASSPFSQDNLHEPFFPVEVGIDITLTKSHPMNDQRLRGWSPGTILEDTAFRPKTYQVRLQKGKFEVRGRTTYGYTPSYEYRLLFDVSPFPPLDEWAYKAPAIGNNFWEREDFYLGKIGE